MTKVSIQSFGFSARLVYILEIVRPIWMNLVATLPVPLFRSFGPLPRSSSEGSLDAFTPSLAPLGESILVLGFFSEKSRESHRFIPFTIRERKPDRRPWIARQPRKRLAPVFSQACIPLGPQFGHSSFYRGFEPKAPLGSLGGLRHLNLMTPRGTTRPGILVSSKPTDEGCRRKHPKYPETVKSKYLRIRRSLLRKLLKVRTVPKA